MKRGFTLSELLLSLTIVGIVAVLTVPVLINNIQKKLFSTQIKNMAAEIEQLAQDLLLSNRTRDLADTDFGDPEKLLSDDHFSISKTCGKEQSLANCWKTSATGKDKVTYKSLNKSDVDLANGLTIILKNGVMLRYDLQSNDGKTLGRFAVDVNGNDKPNIFGRDFFNFYITPKGHIVDISTVNSENADLNTKISKCKTESDASYCYGALVDNNWKMDY